MGAFTGRRRQKRTSKGLIFADFASKWIITLGGIGTIAAVLLVAVFLVFVVWPLFTPARVSERRGAVMPWEERQPVRVDMDEYRQMGWAMFADGSLVMFRLSDGKLMASHRLFDADTQLTAWSFSPGLSDAVFGFGDGKARLGRIGFAVEFIRIEDLPEPIRRLEVGQRAELARDDAPGMIERISDDQFRFVSLRFTMQDPIETGSDSPVVLIDHAVASNVMRLAALHEDGSLFVEELRQRKNIMTNKVVTTVNKAQVPYEAPEGRGRPDYLKLSGLGDSVYAVWKDGLLVRYDVRVLANCRKAETVDLATEKDAVLTQVQFLLGKITLITGDSKGNVRAWFPVRPDRADTPDGSVLVSSGLLHEGWGAAVSCLTASSRGRLLAVGFDDGTARMLHGTSRKLVADLSIGEREPLRFVGIAPKDDGMVALTDTRQYMWGMDVGHPAATFSALFGRVWYESANHPEHVWQSTGGTDDFEEKFGLYPLVFGTIKATIYSLLFGVPIALMAAIYTSEFLHPKVKSKIKPTVEMMASLPSVVLGFLAALVFAPFIENIVPQTLASFFCVPLMFLVGAYGWQLLPQHVSLRLGQWRFAAIMLMLPVGVLVGVVIGPMIENLLFAGDFKLWLDADASSDRFGSGLGGWMFILLPLSGVAVAFAMGRTVNPWLRSISAGWRRGTMAIVDFVRFAVAVIAAVVLSALLGAVFEGIGWDPRGGVMDTYVQRNALVVGFIMGFAIIPIIYTIAEDALSTVPQHLRSASLGAGATPWQTATRIIVPTAMSGLFSAVMIGLGRAVGETMIVLMALGNTPVMEWNMFNGARTLAANIAVELPEAVKDSTHYRTLYLAALVLFVLTFALNTVAETIRQRFRKRAYQL